MTADKDFKRIVRDHARQHGISYAAARVRLRPDDDIRRREEPNVHFHRTAPILRIFDETKARQFYVDYLGMTVDFEHRFEPGMPLYLGLSRGDLAVHLSEHHGDGTPGTHVVVYTTGVEALHAELQPKHDLGNIRPGLERDEIGTWLNLTDPFGNTLRLLEVAQ
ncbi:MAG TPA: glyoxalase superfamily protein [Acidimicrobiales bacterium]|nr:glyoxalase superfamily protein [Acidimicrobiales bacterium]